MEISFKEDVPFEKVRKGVFWLQGFFYMNNQKRVATVTDVKFVSANRLVVAHRAAAKLFLVEIVDGESRILDTLLLDTRHPDSSSRYFHPDLICLHGNSVFMSEYTNRSLVVDVVDDHLEIRNAFTICKEFRYHGCFTRNQFILYGSVKGGTIGVYNTQTGVVQHLRTPCRMRIKTIGMDEDRNFIFGADLPQAELSRPGARMDAELQLYQYDKKGFTRLDVLELPDTQVDGHVFHDGLHYFAIHDGEEKRGKILVVRTSDGKIERIRDVPCNDFPHGLDIRDGLLAYTSYSTSSVILEPLDTLTDIPAR